MEMPAEPGYMGKDALLKQLQEGNDAILQEQKMNLDRLYQEAPSGVEVQKAY
jgi:hypothetical protein